MHAIVEIALGNGIGRFSVRVALERNAQAPFDPPDQRAFFLDGAEHELETFGNGTRIGQLETGSADRQVDHFAIGDRQILIKNPAGFRRQSLGHDTLVSTLVRHCATFTRVGTNLIDFGSCRKLKETEEGPARCSALRAPISLRHLQSSVLVALRIDRAEALRPGRRHHAAALASDETSRGGAGLRLMATHAFRCPLASRRAVVANAPGRRPYAALTARGDSDPKGPSRVPGPMGRGSIDRHWAQP